MLKKKGQEITREELNKEVYFNNYDSVFKSP